MIPIILGLFGALFYFGNSEVHRFENLAARDIRSKLEGSAASVKVRAELNGLAGPFGDLRRVTISASHFSTSGLPLFVEPGFSKKGKIHELRIELKEFSLGGLLVKELTSTIPNCRFDYGLAVSKRKIRLSESGMGRGEVEIREKDLEAFLLIKFHEIKRVSVHVANGRVHVDGYGEFILIATPFSVDAKLEPRNGSQLVLTDATMTFDGKPADEASQKVLLDTLNPVVDLNRDLKLFDAISVDHVSLTDGLLRAGGATHIPAQPNQKVLGDFQKSAYNRRLRWTTRATFKITNARPRPEPTSG